MFLPSIMNSMETGLMDLQVNDIVTLNSETSEFGLSLTKEDVKSIMRTRNIILQSCGRIELGIGATKQIIKVFSASPFISEENYVTHLNELHEIFYCLKNETDDKVGDGEIIEKMNEAFNNDCHGSVELLKGEYFESIVKFFKGNMKDDLYNENRRD